MARKTKKQKKSAELKRTTATTEPTLQYSLKSIPKTRRRTSTTRKPANTNIASSSNYIYQDVRKTIIIAGSLFAAEFLIFWLLEQGGARYLQGISG